MEFILIAYTLWALYSGYQFVGNRVALVQRPGIYYRVLHVILGVTIGYVIGAFTLIKLIIGVLYSTSR